jgi:hypothetical protein
VNIASSPERVYQDSSIITMKGSMPTSIKKKRRGKKLTRVIPERRGSRDKSNSTMEATV